MAADLDSDSELFPEFTSLSVSDFQLVVSEVHGEYLVKSVSQ